MATKKSVKLDKPVKLDEATLKAYAKYVEFVAKSRKRSQGKLNECDFIAGAASVFAFAKAGGLIPSSWLFGPISGKEVFPLGSDDA